MMFFFILRVSLLFTVWLCLCPAFVFADSVTCPEPTARAFGKPLDYADPSSYADIRNALSLVENAHFTREVENLIRGNTSGSDPMGDLDYTLRAFPNHHRALWAVSRYQRQTGKPTKPVSAECYFDRAIRFRPQDSMVRMIYGVHLHLSGKPKEALEQYKLAEQIAPNSSELQYNMGLLYFDLKQYTQAKQYAQKAYQLGYPLPGLRDKLKGVGQWP